MGTGLQALKSPHIAASIKRKSYLVRGHKYRKRTKKGFIHVVRFPNPKSGKLNLDAWQSHHIICQDAFASRAGSITDPAHRDYVEACLWVTDWDINNDDNLIGLPQRIAFTNNLVTTNLCCHQNDHNTTGGYSHECEEYLNVNVWQKLKAGQALHTTTPQDIKSTLDAVSSHFANELTRRGNRLIGSASAWTRRLDATWPDVKRWYVPLSMADDPFVQPRFPSAGLGLNGRLHKLFEEIK